MNSSLEIVAGQPMQADNKGYSQEYLSKESKRERGGKIEELLRRKDMAFHEWLSQQQEFVQRLVNQYRNSDFRMELPPDFADKIQLPEELERELMESNERQVAHGLKEQSRLRGVYTGKGLVISDDSISGHDHRVIHFGLIKGEWRRVTAQPMHEKLAYEVTSWTLVGLLELIDSEISACRAEVEKGGVVGAVESVNLYTLCRARELVQGNQGRDRLSQTQLEELSSCKPPQTDLYIVYPQSGDPRRGVAVRLDTGIDYGSVWNAECAIADAVRGLERPRYIHTVLSALNIPEEGKVCVPKPLVLSYRQEG